MGKNVAVFVDVANIFYAAKAAGVDIDYVLLLKAATAGRDLVRAYAYTGLDPDNENQRNFHSFLARNDFKVVSKDIRKYGDGKVKANLDIELVVDMMKTSRNLDVAVVVSGDGDFAPAIRAVQETGVRVEVISFRGNTSSDLIEVADKFTDITQLAKVEKGSTVSGRRVASDDEDLSMTEVPDKESEGSGRGRGRGRGRARPERIERVEPVAADAEPVRGRGRGRARPAAEPVAATGGALVALPGEKLSKAAAARLAASAEEIVVDEEQELVAARRRSRARTRVTPAMRATRRRRRRARRPRPRSWSRHGARDRRRRLPSPTRTSLEERGGGGGSRRSRRVRRRARPRSDRSGTRRSACRARRAMRPRWTTRSTTTSRRSPSTCSRSAVAASASRAASVAASAAASAVAAARMPRRSIASGTEAVAPAFRRSRAVAAPAAGRRPARRPAGRPASTTPPTAGARRGTVLPSGGPRRSRGARFRPSSRSS